MHFYKRRLYRYQQLFCSHFSFKSHNFDIDYTTTAQFAPGNKIPKHSWCIKITIAWKGALAMISD